MRNSICGFAILLLVSTHGGVAQRDGDSIPSTMLRRLDRIASQLAKRSRLGEAEALVDVMVQLGTPAGEADGRKEGLAKLVPKSAPRRPKDVRGVVRQLRGVCRSLSRHLTSADPERAAFRRRVAAALLDLDDEHEAAHRALGHVQRDGEWMSEAMRDARDRRRQFIVGLQQARRLEVTVETSTCREPVFGELGYPEVSEARFRNVRIFANLEPELLGKLLREAIRGYAFSAFVRTGTLTLPAKSLAHRYLFLQKKAHYLEAIAKARNKGWLSGDEATRAPDEFEFHLPSGLIVGNFVAYSYAFSNVLYDMALRTWGWYDYGGIVPPCLYAGHLNWTCLTYLGVQIPSIGVRGNQRTGRPPRYAHGAASEEWKEAERMAGAGIAGSRSWMAYLAQRRLDPSWSHAMVDQVGKITGDTLLKSTFVAEYLQETGRLDALMKKTVIKGAQGPAAGKKEILAALGEPVATFEEGWRRWFLPRIGIVQRLESGRSKKRDAAAAKAAAYLNELRAAAWDEQRLGPRATVTVDDTLSAGCDAHARYLSKHPDQLAKWPDAHEEYSDRAAFSVVGNWAGMHSVIAPGCRGPRESIDAWMGTFYHRLPLLDAGLIRMGWGMHDRIGVLDSGSIVDPRERAGWIAWPPADRRDVPRAFVPELPNPIPGADQSAWGYPITVQRFADQARVTMRLLDGTKPVPCHFLTPEKPKNLDLVPPRTYCLIPQSHLAPSRTYTVELTMENETFTWTFKTAR